MGALQLDFRSEGQAGPRWSVMVGLSLLLHAGVLGSVVFYPTSIPTRKIIGPGPVYEVSIVEMPAARRSPAGPQVSAAPAAPAATAAAPAPAKTPAPARVAATTDQAPARRIETPRPAEKPAVIAKRTVETPTPAVPKAKVEPPALVDRYGPVDGQRTETEKRDPAGLISDAVSRIQREVDEKRKEDSLIGDAIARLETRHAGAGVGTGAIGGVGGAGAAGTIRERLYVMQVRDRIARNWTYPVTLETVSGDPRAVVTLQVGSNGSVISYNISLKSANPRFDESVLKAVERSDPLPPPPEEYGKQVEITLNFNLSDLRR